MRINAAEYVLQSALNSPDRLAVEDGTHALSYAKLLHCSSRLAELLAACGARRNSPVAILIPKSCGAVVGIVGTSLAGAVYVPLDTASPAERLRTVLGQLGDATVLCVESTRALAESIAGEASRVLCMPAGLLDGEPVGHTADVANAARRRLAEVIDLDPCYVIFTSGSTGTPKGVTIAHRSVIDYIEWARSEYPIRPTHRLASQAPFYFDNSTLDLYLTFASGASLHIPPDRLYAFPKLVLEYLQKRQITTIFWVPSVLVAVANSGLLQESPPTSLEHVLFAGEQMPVPQVNAWVRALPGALFSNLYGPTEITVDCTAYTFREPFEGDILPIGHACRNTDVLILDEEGRQCVAGQTGELCVRGTSLALGYWNDPARTDAVFTQNPLEARFRDLIYRTGDLARRDVNGCITFLGRRDSQIKLNGYRIELGEIEAAAVKVTSVARSAALHDTGRKIIVLFIELLPGQATDITAIRRELVLMLPKYMMPAEIQMVAAFELNKNGKIDRLRLASLLESQH